jgi:hypothetical protein
MRRAEDPIARREVQVLQAPRDARRAKFIVTSERCCEARGAYLFHAARAMTCFTVCASGSITS